jgi:rhamnosyltransferase subunit B
MNVLLASLGSAGDVYPMLALATALQQRGHRARLITTEPFKAATKRLGIGFARVGSTDDYRSVIAEADLWNARKGFEYLLRTALLPGTRPTYKRILEYVLPGTVLVANVFAFGARLAHEKLKLPLATVHFAPSSLWSVRQPPFMAPSRYVRGLPLPVRRHALRAIEALALDRMLGPEINAIRREIGLAPARSFCSRWLNSPQRVIGCFPEWFAPPPSDWPAQVRLTGFLSFDGRETETPRQSFWDFLSCGEAPIVFTPGTAMEHGESFFRTCVEACRILGRRGILLTRFQSHLPARLPGCVMHCDYLPFGLALPHVAALVHHGGIGTTAQALAAGIPQLIMPLSFDQPDNAARVARLGAGDWLAPEKFTAPRAAHKLERLLTDPTVAANCIAYKQRIDFDAHLRKACETVEELAA